VLCPLALDLNLEAMAKVSTAVMTNERQPKVDEVSAITQVQQKAAALQKRGGEACVAVKNKALNVAGESKVKAGELADRAVTLARASKEKAQELAKDRRTQVTAASAGLGGVACGAGGAAAGLVTGGALGAAAGIPVAFFTFGLSIPVGAMLGGGFGLVAGGAAGTTVGATAGGALGYGGFTKRAEIQAAILAVRTQMRQGAKKLKELSMYFAARSYSGVKTVKKNVLKRVSAMRSRVEKKVGGWKAGRAK